MQKLIKDKNILFSIILLFLAVLLTASFLPGIVTKSTSAAGASTPHQTNQHFTVSVIDRKTENENTNFTQESLPFGKSFVYEWAETKSFKFNYDPTVGTAPSPRYLEAGNPDTAYYDFSISIEFIKAYKDNIPSTFEHANKVVAESAYQLSSYGMDSYTEFATQNFELNIDEGKSVQVGPETTKRIQTWGVYRFKLLINDQQTYSDFFVIEPKMHVNKAPVLSYYTDSSASSLHDDYIFSIKNSEEYKYTDTSKIIWYVTGTTEDGTLYVLTAEDLALPQFTDKAYHPLYPSYDTDNRTGLNFRFDDKGTTGTWQVWCEYNYAGSTEPALVSNVEKIKTGSQIKLMPIIITIASVFALTIIVVLIFAIIKTKKDRVY